MILLRQYCFEFHPKKSIWGSIAKDGLARWTLVELLPKLTVRTYLEEPCGGGRIDPPYVQVNLSLETPFRDYPELYLSTLEQPSSDAFPFLPLDIPQAQPVPNLKSAADNPKPHCLEGYR